jgi:hypothetical protein
VKKQVFLAESLSLLYVFVGCIGFLAPGFFIAADVALNHNSGINPG